MQIVHTSLVGAMVTSIRIDVVEEKSTQQRALDKDMAIICRPSIMVVTIALATYYGIMRSHTG